MTFDSARQQLVVFGGRDGAVARRDVWERRAERWVERTDPESGPVARSDFGFAFDTVRQRSLVFGGLNERRDTLRDLWEWDGSVWTARTSEQGGPSARGHLAMAYDRARARLVVFGGAPTTTSVAGDLWEWDDSGWSDRTAPAGAVGPSARRDASMTYDVARGRIVLFGGRLEGNVAASDLWEWDGTSWQAGPSGPPARFDACLVYDDARRKSVLYGGTTTGDVWEYDGVSWVERTPSTLGPGARRGAQAAYDETSARVVMHGGSTGPEGSSVTVNDTWSWDGTQWTELPTRAAAPPFRSYVASAYDSGRARSLLFGGIVALDATSIVLRDDTWEWDGAGWTERIVAVKPPARYFGSAAYDAARGVTVLFGGAQTTDGATFVRLGDTWTWDGTAWTDRTPSAVGPQPRAAASFAYDAVRQRVVLYGGTTNSEQLADLWEWDGAAWTERTPPAGAPGPGAVALPSVVYDPESQRVVLFGGLGPLGYGSDLWSWDGSSWTITPSSDSVRPPAVSGALVSDTKRSSLLLVTSADPSTFADRTQLWEWSSSRWTQLPIDRSPPVVRDPTILQHDARQQILFYGGSTNFNVLDETCILSSRGAPCASAAESSTGFCVDGVACESAQCATCETCAAPESSGRCTPVRTAEDPDTCGAERRSSCDAAGLCRLTLGSPATDGAECVSGFVTDGVCCEASSCGACRTCDASEKEIPDNDGRCGTRRAGTDPRNECAEDAVATCGFDGTCDGRGGCRSYVAGTACGPVVRAAERISSSVCTGAGDCTSAEASCDGEHTLLVPGADPIDCGAFGCEGPACKASCASVADCASGFECDGNRACVPRSEAPAEDGGCSCETGSTSPRDFASSLLVAWFAFWLARRRFARGHGAAVAVGLVGLTGCSRSAPDPAHRSQTAELAVGETVTWARVGLPSPRYEGSLVFDVTRQRVLAFGGHNDVGLARTSYRDLWEDDGLAWIERTPSSGGPVGRHAAAFAYDRARGRAVLFGGIDVLNLTSLGDHWEWDGRSWTQRLVDGPKPPPRHLAAMCFDEVRQRMILFGGARRSVLLNETWEWDGNTWQQRALDGAPAARIGASLVFDVARSVAVLTGGENGSGHIRDTWEWDGQSWTDRTPPAGQGPGARVLSATTYDRGRSRLVLFGGTSGSVNREVWERDPEGTWVQRTPPSGGPTSRLGAGMAYDERRQQVVLFGGLRDGATLGDTWDWDGTTWTSRTPGPQPGPRLGHASSFDPIGNRVLMYGGRSGTTDLGQLWQWNGGSWEDRTVATGGPVARAYPVMASGPDRTVIFGGRIAEVPTRELWEWNGSSWQDRTAAEGGPIARWLSAMTYDTVRARWVLFGGLDAAGEELGDTWEWDGTTWTQRTPLHSPSPRRLHTMSYDPDRQRIVLYGGAYDFGYNRELWEWDGNDWVDRTIVSGGPGAYAYAQSVYDASRKVVIVMVGPGTSFGEQNEIWAWDGVTWTRLPTQVRPNAEIEYSLAYDPVRARTVFAGGSMQSLETWELVGRGAPCTSALDSTTGFCVDGVSCSTGACPGSCEACDVPGSEGICTPVVSAPDPDTCADGKVCDRDGSCRAALGQPAIAPEDCASGFVVDGVCCETATCAACSTCTAAQKEIPDNDGRCGTQRAGLDLREECATTPPETCGNDGTCDGRGACRQYALGTVCASGSICSGAGVCAAENAGCDGDGAVRAANGKRTECGGFRCVDAACLTSCTSLAECTVGSVCDAEGRCIPESTDPTGNAGCACDAVGFTSSGTWPIAAGALMMAFARRRRSCRLRDT